MSYEKDKSAINSIKKLAEWKMTKANKTLIAALLPDKNLQTVLIFLSTLSARVTFVSDDHYEIIMKQNAALIAALKELNEAFYKIESILTEDSDILWLNETEWKEIKSAIENAKHLTDGK